jgi:succinoglycan biosynthesis transport protein ExoP
VKSTPSPVRAVLKMLLRWWWLIAIAVALGAGVGYFIRSRQPDIWYARATILFDQNLLSGGQIGNLTTINDYMTVYAELARRDRILLPVINTLQLNMSVDDLNARLGVQAVPNLPLLEVLVGDTDPLAAAGMANAIAQEIINASPTSQLTAEQAFKRAQLQDLQTQIENAQTDYNNLVAAGANLTAAYDIAQNSQQQLAALATVRELQQLYASLSVGLTDKSGLLSIFEAASAETAIPVRSSMTSVIFSAVGGLVLALGTVVLITFLDDRLEWQEDLESVQGVKVLGPLGLVPRGKLPLYADSMPNAIEAEMLRQLRAKLVLLSGDKPPKVVTITSYDSGDGKTVTAANLALVTAQSGLRTLLVDGDIRKGDAHDIFRLPNVMGLSDILTSHEDLEVLLSQALLDSGYDNLTVLTSGRSNADPAALVSSPRFKALVDILQKQFDTVIMDSVPTIGGPDSAFMAEASDGVIIVIHAQRTTHKALERTLQTLQQGKRVNVYGLVFNRIPLQVTSSYSKPYYRRTLAISPEKLQEEFEKANSKRRLLPLKQKNVIKDETGEALYSYAAAASKLGITEENLKNLVETGYLKMERRGNRRWVRQSALDEYLNRIPRSTIHPITETNGHGPLTPDVLLNQRDALLQFAREPQKRTKKKASPDETPDEV